MTNPIYTYSDAIEHLTDFGQVTQSANRHRLMRRAVESAVVRLGGMYDWSVLSRQKLFTVTAPVSGTCTVAQESDGSYTATIASGTWPAWTDSGRIKIGSEWCEILRLSSATVAVIQSGIPSTGSQTFQLVRDRYILPPDINKVESVHTGPQLQYQLMPSPPGQEQSEYHRTNRPTGFSVRDAGEYYGRKMLILTPAPSTSEQLLVYYRSEIRPPRLERFDATATLTSGSAVLTSSTATPEEIVGSILRVGSGVPTGSYGDGRTSRDSLNLPLYERTVVARNSATELVLDAAIDTELSGNAIVVSDPIDIDRGGMMNAFWRLAEEEYLGMSGANAQKMSIAQSRSMDAVRNAMESDATVSVHPTHGAWVVNPYPWFSDPWSEVSG